MMYRSKRTGEVFEALVDAFYAFCVTNPCCAECAMNDFSAGGSCIVPAERRPEMAAFIMGLEPVEYVLPEPVRVAMRVLGCRWATREVSKDGSDSAVVLWTREPGFTTDGMRVVLVRDEDEDLTPAALSGAFAPDLPENTAVEVDALRVLPLGVSV